MWVGVYDLGHQPLLSCAGHCPEHPLAGLLGLQAQRRQLLFFIPCNGNCCSHAQAMVLSNLGGLLGHGPEQSGRAAGLSRSLPGSNGGCLFSSGMKYLLPLLVGSIAPVSCWALKAATRRQRWVLVQQWYEVSASSAGC
eukprot:1152301-Pelagomonas_calceolata.AAC.6